MVSQISRSIHIWTTWSSTQIATQSKALISRQHEKLETGPREDDRKVLLEINVTPLFTPKPCLSCMTGNTIAVRKIKNSNFFAEVGSRVSIHPPALPASMLHNRSEPIPFHAKVGLAFSNRQGLKSSEASEGLTDVRRVALSTATERIHGMVTPLLAQHKSATKLIRGAAKLSPFLDQDNKQVKDRKADIESIKEYQSINKPLLDKILDTLNKAQETFAEECPDLAALVFVHDDDGKPSAEFEEWKEGFSVPDATTEV
ncbi:hypothetical protein HO173_000547 [Letharia columbiana]|uniref:Uncharacterized protein n=1 Tax=Letharia columbiana TaxID=112416 RepID=A0A8H6G7C7_9LECA|nr:uncharacterized protein HO173_000547 [Letharia columbiana]KAF6241835.1 hypothetical protein HO173_000547 [Letharia columbiana]